MGTARVGSYRAWSRLSVPLLFASLGCSVQTEFLDQEATGGAVHAVVQIRRVEMYDAKPHGDALAAFVRVPEGAQPEQLLNAVGLWPIYPEIGQCEVASSYLVPSSNELITAELLSAEGVELRTAGGLHRLAPHAFPSAYDLLRGVVYSSRDQAAADLPESNDYLVVGFGVETEEFRLTPEGPHPTAGFQSRHLSPAFPAEVRVQELPFEGVSSVPAQQVLDFSWSKNAQTDDIIVISFSTQENTYQCSFADADGFGTVPLLLPSGKMVLDPGTTARVRVSRIRNSYDSHPEFARIGIGFDFAVERTWLISVADSPPSTYSMP